MEDKILKHIQVYNWIIGMISRNKIEINDKLPTETEIANIFGYNRMTVRKAFDMLVNEGVIERKQGKGTFLINDINSGLTYNLNNIVSFENIAKSNHLVPKYTTIKKEKQPGTKSVCSDLLIPQNSNVIFLTRIIYANNIPVILERSYFPSPEFDFILNIDLNGANIYPTIMDHKSEISLHHSKQYLKSSIMTETEKKLLDYDLNNEYACTQQKNIIYDPQSIPILIFYATFPGDKFQFEVESGKYSPRLNGK